MPKFITIHQPKKHVYNHTFYPYIEVDNENCVEYFINVDNIVVITSDGVVLNTGDKIRTKETMTELKKLIEKTKDE